MVSAATIRKLATDLDALERIVSPRQRVVAIAAPVPLDKAAVIQRHFELYPEDREAELHVIFRNDYGDDYTPDPDRVGTEWSRMDSAWREIAREARGATA